jgi:hypothetical protein
MRLLVGLLLAGLFCIQCSSTEAFKESPLVVAVSGKIMGKNAPEVLAKVEELARTDHVALLEFCQKSYKGRFVDYTCTLIKQERINGEFKPEQWIEVKFLDSPFSVAMKWTKNPPIGEQVLYVDGKYNNQMLVKPKGWLGNIVGTVPRPPNGPEAMQNTLRPVNEFGFYRSLQNLLDVYRGAKARGDLKEEFGGYAEVDGRKSIVLVRHLPPDRDYPAKKTMTYIDLEYLLPICVKGYDWDDQPSSLYIFKDVKFNMGLTPEQFTPEANGMKPPR